MVVVACLPFLGPESGIHAVVEEGTDVCNCLADWQRPNAIASHSV
jgi:hypothetical protein